MTDALRDAGAAADQDVVVVAGGDASPLLDVGEGPLDDGAHLLVLALKVTGPPPVEPRRCR